MQCCQEFSMGFHSSQLRPWDRYCWHMDEDAANYPWKKGLATALETMSLFFFYSNIPSAEI